MGSAFRPSGRTLYRIDYKDQHGKRQIAGTGMKDRRAAEGLLHLVERDAQLLAAGLPAEHPEVTWKFLGLEQPHATTPKTWQEAQAEYLAELARRGSKPEETHYREVKRKLERIRRECNWETLLAVKKADFTRFLGRLSEAGRAPRTQNSYQETLPAFLNWCASQEWLTRSPIDGLKMLEVGESGRRRRRRAYTLAEWQALLAVAPEPRRTVYLVAAFSGFRRSELRRLQKQDCTPVGTRPRWHVRAEVTKNGRSAHLPMLPDCAEALALLWQSLPSPTSPLFVDRCGRCSVPHVVTLHEDMEAAGIARQDERGRWADFHSFRYFFCTQMGRRRPIQEAKALMRHSTIKLTADLYTDLGIEDVAEEAWTLDRLFPPSFPALADPHTASHTAMGNAG
jgi:integrase